MATVSNPVTLSSVKTVFGGPSTLSSYLRGGSYVPNIANAYPSVATTLPLALSSFAGVIYPAVTALSAYSIVGSGLAGGVEIQVEGANGSAPYQIIANTTTTWMLTGHPADYDVYFLKTSGVISSGTVNTWLNLATTREWGVTRGTVGTSSGTGTITIRNAASPQVNLISFSVYMEWTKESSQCPTCCFTPDTLVLMASGEWMPIVDVQVGDEIATSTGSKRVTEVITRTNRVMYQITFMDGRILNASEDHPLYVVDKGYAAINPGVGGEYKDLGIPDMLYVGDLVLDSDGKENAIVSIELIDYPHTVYTFMESEFYANGMLVY